MATWVARVSAVNPDMPLSAGRATSEISASRANLAGMAPRASKDIPDFRVRTEEWVPQDHGDPLATPAGVESMAWTDSLAPRVNQV